MDDIKLEDARIDAAYREKKDSKKPALESALKGGLASGLLARIAKPRLRRTEAALIGTGTAIGGAIGQANHDNSIDRKRKAQSLLKSAIHVSEYGHPATNAIHPEQGGAGADAVLGGVAGGALGAMGAGKIPRGKWAAAGALGGALTGYASGKVVDKMTHHQEEKGGSGPSIAMAAGVAGAVDGAISPIIQKGIGTRTKKGGDFHKGVKDSLKDKNKPGLFGKMMGTGVDERAILDGVNKEKGDRFFNKATLKASGVGMLRNGLIGGAFGYGIDRLSKHLEEKRMAAQQGLGQRSSTRV